MQYFSIVFYSNDWWSNRHFKKHLSFFEAFFFTDFFLHLTYLIEILDCKSNHSRWLHQFQIHSRIFHMFSYVTYDLSFLYKHFQSPGKVAVTKGNWVIQLLSYNMTIQNHINAFIHTHQQCFNHVSIIWTCERTIEWVSEGVKERKWWRYCRYFI